MLAVHPFPVDPCLFIFVLDAASRRTYEYSYSYSYSLSPTPSTLKILGSPIPPSPHTTPHTSPRSSYKLYQPNKRALLRAATTSAAMSLVMSPPPGLSGTRFHRSRFALSLPVSVLAGTLSNVRGFVLLHPACVHPTVFGVCVFVGLPTIYSRTIYSRRLANLLTTPSPLPPPQCPCPPSLPKLVVHARRTVSRGLRRRCRVPTSLLVPTLTSVLGRRPAASPRTCRVPSARGSTVRGLTVRVASWSS